MSEDKLKKRCWELQREVDRLTGANQALQDVNGRLQIERALLEVRRMDETVSVVQATIRTLATEHAKEVASIQAEIKRLDGRVTAAGKYFQEKLNGEAIQ